MQARMVRRTCAAIERATGRQVLAWRNHSYCFDRHTPRALVEAGVRVWSDDVDPDGPGPYRHESGVVILPINTTPDHEHLLHGGQTEETIAAARLPEYHDADSWRERVVQQTEAIVGRGGIATILAHPLCMKVVDDWRTFERLCSALSAYRSGWASEAARAIAPKTGRDVGTT